MDALARVGRAQEPVPLALRDDDDGVRDDVAFLGAPGLDLEPLLHVLEDDDVAIGIDVVNVELRGLGLIGDEELLHALLDRIRGAEQDPHLDRLGERAQRLDGRGRERVALARGPVPPREMTTGGDVEENGDDDRRRHTDELRDPRRIHAGHSLRFALHPHLHMSTARTVPKSGTTTSEP